MKDFLLRRFTDYYKIKDDLRDAEATIIKLQSDVATLIDAPNSQKSFMIKFNYEMIKNIDKAIWHGNANN